MGVVGFLAFMFLLSQALASGGDYWVQYWVDKNQITPESINYGRAATEAVSQWFKDFYNDEYFDIYVFGIIVLFTIVISIWRSYLFFNVSHLIFIMLKVLY